jgi:hypothetical protein
MDKLIEDVSIININLSGIDRFNSTNDSLVIFNGVILLIKADIDEQSQNDIINSILFANLATTKKIDPIKQAALWYKTYHDILNNVGWVVQDLNFSTYESPTKRYLLLNTVLNLVKSDELLISAKSINFLKELDDDDERLQLFQKQSLNSLGQGAFQFLIASQNEGGPLLHFISYSFIAKKIIDNLIWQYFDRSKIELNFSNQEIILNLSVYSQVRDTIKQKLTAANPKVLQIDLIDS